jgi:ACT domain-containing protein
MMEECKLQINLEDKPGELSKVLDIIAKNKGNLFSVSHIREKKKEGRVPVIITLQATDKGFEGIIFDLQKASIEVTEKKIGGLEEAQLTQEFILIGHIIDSDIKDTIYAICDKDVMVKSLDISLKSLKEKSSAFAEIGAKDQQALDNAMRRLEDIAKKKDLLLITGIKT